MKSYRFHPEALAEYDAAAVWYRERSYKGALLFAALVDDGILGIRFPCSIIYLEERNEIVIVAIAHHKRRPGYWLHRLRR